MGGWEVDQNLPRNCQRQLTYICRGMDGRASSLLPCEPISIAKVGPCWQIIQGKASVRGSLVQRNRLFTGVSIPGTDLVGQDVNDGNCANDKITDERR